MAQVTNILKVTINGMPYRTAQGGKFNLGGFAREAVIADNQVVGPTETVKPAELDVTIPHTSALDTAELKDIMGATLRVETDTGVVFVSTNAFTMDTLEMTGGELALKMSGDPAFEE